MEFLISNKICILCPLLTLYSVAPADWASSDHNKMFGIYFVFFTYLIFNNSNWIYTTDDNRRSYQSFTACRFSILIAFEFVNDSDAIIFIDAFASETEMHIRYENMNSSSARKRHIYPFCHASHWNKHQTQITLLILPSILHCDIINHV